MSDSIKLHNAIKAMENGLKSLSYQQNEYRNKQNEFKIKGDSLESEIKARRKMLDAMIELQDVLGKDETIKFIIP